MGAAPGAGGPSSVTGATPGNVGNPAAGIPTAGAPSSVTGASPLSGTTGTSGAAGVTASGTNTPSGSAPAQ
jgi:hypothetical protein